MSEVGKEISEHLKEIVEREESRHDRIISIVEAVLLATVALLAAYSGYASAKWSTESRLRLAQASTARTQAENAQFSAIETRNFNSSTFEAWFNGYVADDTQKMEVAERRSRPEFLAAFNAWLATDPLNNPNARPGPTYMLRYQEPELTRAENLPQDADRLYNERSRAGTNGDDYVRASVYLATVLFLVGISGHFRVASARYGLIAVGSIILFFTVSQLIVLAKPPA
jgi:hypothetical protein